MDYAAGALTNGGLIAEGMGGDWFLFCCTGDCGILKLNETEWGKELVFRGLRGFSGAFGVGI